MHCLQSCTGEETVRPTTHNTTRIQHESIRFSGYCIAKIGAKLLMQSEIQRTRCTVSNLHIYDYDFSRSYCYTVMIGCCHDTVVCLSVCNIVYCGAQGMRLKVVASRSREGALPIDFLRRFCCKMYRSATTHSEKRKRRNFRVWNCHGQRAHVTMAIPTRKFRRFCSAATPS